MLVFTLAGPMSAGATEAGWALLRNGGQVVLLRHAAAPGNFDPPNFDIEKCNTQRNLSDRGRQQAEKIGALIAARAGDPERVLTSRYCRTRDTARIAFEDSEIVDMPALDPPSPDAAAAETAKAEILEAIRTYSGTGNLIMVTHLETIRELTGISPREGEAVIVSADEKGAKVLARIIFN